MATATVSPDTKDCTPAQRVTESLLGYGVLAAFVWLAVVSVHLYRRTAR